MSGNWVYRECVLAAEDSIIREGLVIGVQKPSVADWGALLKLPLACNVVSEKRVGTF